MAEPPGTEGARTPRARRATRALVLLLVALLGWLAASIGVAYELTRRPQAIHDEALPSIDGVALTSLRLATTDGESLGAWLLEPPAAAGPSVVMLHGNGGTRGSRLDEAAVFTALGCPVLAVTMRAHGDSTGEINDFGWGARHDVAAAVGWLEQSRPGEPVVVCGTSLGAAAAIFAADALGTRLAGLVLECPYRDLPTAVRNRTEAYLPPLLDRLAAEGLILAGRWFLDVPEHATPLAIIASVPDAVPVLLMAGGRDRRSRPDEVAELYEAVATHARWVLFEDAEHEGLLVSDADCYAREVASFVAGLR